MVLSRQARGRPQEAAKEVRALLDLMRENEAAVQDESVRCITLLNNASVHLNILDPEHGEEELIELVAAALAKLSLPLRQPCALVLCISPRYRNLILLHH